jgi:hypothetical protein
MVVILTIRAYFCKPLHLGRLVDITGHIFPTERLSELWQRKGLFLKESNTRHCAYW